MNFAQKKISFVLLLILLSISTKCEIIPKESTLSKYLNLDSCLHFTATVSEFKDGDTVYVKRQDNGEIEKIRFLGINTPEKSYTDDGNIDPVNSEPYAIKASEFTKNALQGKTFTVYYSSNYHYQRDPYDRLLGVIAVEGTILNVDLLREGLAKRFFYNENPIMKFEEWTKAEGAARKRKINLWSHYHSQRIVITEVYPDPPGDETNTGEEFIEIKNFGKKAVNLKNWLIMMDRSTHYNTLTSQDFILNPGEICVISTVPESDFRALFPSFPSNAKYLNSEYKFYFKNNPHPPQQRIFYLCSPDKYIEETLTFSLDWYDGLRNGGKSLQRVNFRKIEEGTISDDSPDKQLFKADTPTPGIISQ